MGPYFIGPDKTPGRECRWLEPKLVGHFEFVEWTDVNHLRHTKFVALRDDKKAKAVKRELKNE